MRARLLLFGLLLAFAAPDANAELVVTAEADPDESHPRYTLVFGKVGSRTTVGQSFVATMSGRLHSAYLTLYCDPGADQPLDASIHAVEGGVPGEVLATTSTAPERFPDGDVGFIGFDFTASGTRLSAGSTYALVVTPHVLKTQGQFYPHALMVVWTPDPTPYPDGFVYDSTDGAATFVSHPAADSHFRVVVDQSAPVVGSTFGRLKGSYGGPGATPDDGGVDASGPGEPGARP